MAAYPVAAAEFGAYEKTLVASTADTVTFTGDVSKSVEILNEGTVGLYATINGVVPTVGDQDAYYVPPNSVRTIKTGASSNTVVTLISSGTPKYSVSKEI